jgi:PAS domain S-box-containing protein
MNVDTKRTTDAWAQDYGRLLRASVEHRSADVLEQAGSLGRSLVQSGVPPHELVAVHLGYVARVDGDSGAAERAAADSLLVEALKAYGEIKNAVDAQSTERPDTQAKLERAEQALRESERRYRTLFESIPVGVYRTTPDGRIDDANPALVKMLGFSSFQELAERNLEEDGFEPEYSRSDFRERIEREGTLTLDEVAWKKRDGSMILVRENARAVRDVDGRVVFYEGTVEDVTARRQAMRALKESEREYRALVEELPNGLVVVQGLPPRLVLANQALAEISGRSVEELLSLSPTGVEALIHPADRATFFDRYRARLAGKPATPHYEFRAVRKDGTVRWVEIFSARIVYRGEPGVRSVLLDITERKEAEEGLRHSEEIARVLLDAWPDAGVLLDPEGRILALNERCARGMGARPEDLVGECAFDLLRPDVARTRKEATAKVLRTGRPHRFEDEHNGRLFDSHMHPLFDSGGQVSRVAVFARDITEARRAEEALRAQHDLALALSATSDLRQALKLSLEAAIAAAGMDCGAVYLIDERSGTVDLACQAGLSPELTEAASHFAPGSQAARILETGEPVYTVFDDLVRRLGRDLPNEGLRASAVIPLRHDGAAIGCLNVGSHVLDGISSHARNAVEAIAAQVGSAIARLKAEVALREQREIFENVLAHIPHSVFWKDRDSVFLGCNENFAREAGVSGPEQIVGKTDYDLPWTKEQADFYVQCDREVISTDRIRRNIEEPARRADGSEAMLLTSKTPLRDRNGAVIGVLGIYADITELKQMEETLRRQALVFANMDEAVVMTDADRRITDWNPGAQRMFGYTADEVLGQTPRFLLTPEDAPEWGQRIPGTLRREGYFSREMAFQRKDGRQGYCEVVAVGLRDGDDKFAGVIAVVRDVTDRKRAEEEARRRCDELAHVSRLAMMGEMASGLAHELNQPLSAILYYARGSLRRLRSGAWGLAEIRRVMDKVAAQAERAAEFMARLRAFVRKGGLRLSPIDLNLTVREAVGFIEHEAHETGVIVELQLSKSLPRVLADAIQIEQVILNLARNGIEAMHTTEAGKRRLAIRTARLSDDRVVCAICDVGPGSADQNIEQWFDAFFTTKPDGMGMGLPISRSIVETHGGRLWVTPNPSGGTITQFTLPVFGEGQDHGD